MATVQQVKRTAVLAIVVGIATMALSNGVAKSSTLAGVVAFVVGLGVVGVGILKIGKAAKVRD